MQQDYQATTLGDFMSDADLVEEIAQRADKAGIGTEIRETKYVDDIIKTQYILMPAGAEPRRIPISSQDQAKEILSIEFERFTFLGDYDAIADLKRGEIEAALTTRDAFGGISMIERRLGFSSGVEGALEDDENQGLSLQAESSSGIKLEISAGSESLRVFSSRAGGRAPLSLKIFLNEPQSYSSALSALEVISNSLFFQIDLERDVTLSLRKSFRRRRGLRRKGFSSKEAAALQFPSFEYDTAPISLYWYAKSARGMPLLQFLAYYQVAEYYFPNFAKLEAIRGVRKILKHPNFRVDRESDLTKLVSTIAGSGRVGGSEREQIRATVSEVITLDDVLRYFEENADVAEIVSKKQKGITDKTINLGRKGHDHRPDVAELLYDIRCRIVHTKNDVDNIRSEMLLPFSKAEEELWAYVDLMQFVAQNALIRSSSVMRSF
ncbi:hypothetical protein [Rhodovulum marinum]|nr:hypothetical protein [Rhodovulum marinum]